MNENINTTTDIVSPWDMTENFLNLWDGNKFSWIALTIILVWLVYKISTRAISKKSVSWRGFLLWIISIVGWAFLMYMTMWEMMNTNPFFTILLLVGTSILTILGVLILFKLLKNPEKKDWGERIISGIILSIIVFGILVFMGSNQQELGLASLMGALLGFFISSAWYNFINMKNADDNTIEEINDDEDDWVIPGL